MSMCHFFQLVRNQFLFCSNRSSEAISYVISSSCWFFIIEIRQCSPYTSVDDCQVFYAYRYLPNRGGYSVFIKDEKGECVLTVLLAILHFESHEQHRVTLNNVSFWCRFWQSQSMIWIIDINLWSCALFYIVLLIVMKYGNFSSNLSAHLFSV